MSLSIWSDDRIQTLRDLFAAKHSASEIAASLGGVTRNAVCGKLARLGLVRGWGPQHPDKVIKVKPARVRKFKAPLPPGAPKFNPQPFICADAADIVPLNITFADLQDGDCKWPYDAPAGSAISHVFCGHPALSEKPYCQGHTRLSSAGIPTRKIIKPTAYGQSKGGVFGRVA